SDLTGTPLMAKSHRSPAGTSHGSDGAGCQPPVFVVDVALAVPALTSAADAGAVVQASEPIATRVITRRRTKTPSAQDFQGRAPPASRVSVTIGSPCRRPPRRLPARWYARPTVEFGLLGPFEARHDGAVVDVGKRRQERCLLGVLLLQAGRSVAMAKLVDLLWDGDPPGSAR